MFSHYQVCTPGLVGMSVEICELLEIEVKKPRIHGRQIMRDNVQSEGPEDYFRKSITVPFLDYTLNEKKQ
jgi:hypothetical protein